MPIRPTRADDLVATYGGRLHSANAATLGRFSPIDTADEGDLAPLLAGRFVSLGIQAAARGALLLVDERIAQDSRFEPVGWSHPYAAWVMACILEDLGAADRGAAVVGSEGWRGPHVTLGERVIVGERVSIGAGTAIGGVGFGWARGPEGAVKRIPHLGGVVIEDDVAIGPLCSIDAGVLAPTVLRRGARLDAQVHIAHNCEVGEGTFIAAQCGLAGSVKLGRGVLLGGQVGIADHVTVGDGARIAAKSGVIGDVPAHVTVAGYPAVPRARWLRGLAHVYRALAHGRNE